MPFALDIDATTLPYLQTWLDVRPGMYVLGLEPCNADRAPDGTTVDNPELLLPSGASRRYALSLRLG